MNEKQNINIGKTKKEKKSSVLNKNDVLAETVSGAGALAAGYFLGGCDMLFSARPLGLALLSASTRQAPFVFIGLLLSIIGSKEKMIIHISSAVMILLIRVLCRLFIDDPKEKLAYAAPSPFDKLGMFFSENRYLRALSAGVGGFLIGIYNIISGGFRFYDLFGTVFYIVITPVACLLYTEFFDTRERGAARKITSANNKSKIKLYDISCVALICSLIFSLDGETLFGLSLSVCVACFASLYYSKDGLLRAIIVSLFFGLAVSPIYAPLFAFCAIACYLLRQVSLFSACIGACIVGMVWGIYVGGIGALTFIFPALLSSAMLYCTAEKLNLFSDISNLFDPEAPSNEENTHAIVEKKRADGSLDTIKGISESFSALSKMFYELSDKLRRPALLDLRHICDKTFDEYCPDCDGCDLCWGIEYSSMLDELRKISTSIHSSGKADIARLSPALRERCLYLPEIVKDINSRCAKATRDALLNEKTEVFALDYDAVSKILSDAIKENELDYKLDRALSKKLSAVLENEGFGRKSITAYGTGRKKIIAKGLDLSENASGAKQLHDSLEDACGFPLSEPVFELSAGCVNMQCQSKRLYDIESCFELSPAPENRLCGDNVILFENKNEYFYALISDGMGSGENASFTSKICSSFLHNMLLAGNKTETSVRMLNSVLRAKGSTSALECSATVDLFELDTYSGKATFFKSGASPTYLLRDGNVFMLSAPGVPIGIIKTIEANEIELSCKDGDIIVMVSDGISKNDEEISFLPEMLTNKWENDLPKMAKKIVEHARKKEESRDDISVIILKIVSAE